MNERDWDRVAGSWDDHIMSSLYENVNGSIAALIASGAASSPGITATNGRVMTYLRELCWRSLRRRTVAAT